VAHTSWGHELDVVDGLFGVVVQVEGAVAEGATALLAEQ